MLTTRGGPERPLSFDELATKFRDNASRGLDPQGVEQLQRSCRELAQQEDLSTTLAPLTRVDRIDLGAPDAHNHEGDS